jgi:putative ABC transport system permease protein
MGPIIRALFRSKTTAILIILEIAITLAIVSNALSMISERAKQMARPSGMDEASLFVFSSVAIDEKTYDADAAFAADRARLLALPGVENVYATDSYPLSNSGSSTSVSTGPDDSRSIRSATYYADENTLATLGVKLVAGRNFDAREIVPLDARAGEAPRQILLSQALATQLYPDGNALGKRLPGPNDSPDGPEIIGIYSHLQAPWPSSDDVDNTSLLPFRPRSNLFWMIRANPEMIPTLKVQARETLAKADRSRVIGVTLQTMTEVRQQSYSDHRAMVVLMSLLSILLITVTALGIVGMASFWVTQRTKQIGTRRALGATRSAIVRDFQVENFLLSVAGSVLGVAFAYGLNFWFAKQANVTMLPALDVLIGVAVVLVLGQIAVLRPAQRASRIAPAIATRSV